MYHNAILCAVFLAGGCVSFRYMVHNRSPPKRSSPSSSIDGCIYRQGPVVVSKIIDFQNTANRLHSMPIFFPSRTHNNEEGTTSDDSTF